MNRPRTAERLPLVGQTVVVTRPRQRAGALSAALAAAGASVVEFPTIQFTDPVDETPLREALARLDGFDWVVFTSPTGVERVLDVLGEVEGGVASLARRAVAAIGPVTRAALERGGVSVRLVPHRYRAEELLEALVAAVRESGRAPGATRAAGSKEPDGSLEANGEAESLRGMRVLIPRAADARSTLPDGLRRLGALVDVVTAYRTESGAPDVEHLRGAIRRGEVDWITFTASSTARHFVRLVGTDIGRARVAAIGPVTAETARALGLPVNVTATEHTAAGLVTALVSAARTGRS